MDDAARRARAEKLFDEYLDAEARGNAPNEEAYLVEHGDVRDLLASLLADRRRMQELLEQHAAEAPAEQSRVNVSDAATADSGPAS